MANLVTHLETAAVIDLADWNAAHVVTFVGAKAYATSTQACTGSALTAVAFDSEEFDTDTFHDNSTNNSRFTIPSGKAGKYLVSAGGLVPNSGQTIVLFEVNGSTFVRGGQNGNTPGNRSNVTTITTLAVGDYIEVVVFPDAGITIGHASELQSQMTMLVQWLGA